eukprot:331617_1
MGATATSCLPTDEHYEKIQYVDKDIPSFRISHIKYPGRAQAMRLAATIGGIGFEDVFLKKDSLTRKKIKRTGLAPHLTIMDIDGNDLVTIKDTQSQLRYVGRISGLYNGSGVNKTLIDEIVDHCEDCSEEICAALRTETKEDDELIMTERIPYWLNKLENKLQENINRGHSNGYFVGDKISIADLRVNNLFEFLCQDRVKGGKQLAQEKKTLMQHKNKIDEIDEIKAFNKQLGKDRQQFKQNASISSFKRKGKFVPGKF